MFGQRNGGGHSGLILKDMEVRGAIIFKDIVTVEGVIVGEVNSESGHLIVNKEGRIEGNVQVNAASIGGEVVGDVFAQTRIDIQATGKIVGNVCAPVLTVDAGAYISGKVETAAPSATKSRAGAGALKEKDGPPELRAIG
jgi:cytoskeletal protein CcmA (bactofilin family)